MASRDDDDDDDVRSSNDSTETQRGVKRLQAVRQTWTKWSLAWAYVGYDHDDDLDLPFSRRLGLSGSVRSNCLVSFAPSLSCTRKLTPAVPGSSSWLSSRRSTGKRSCLCRSTPRARFASIRCWPSSLSCRASSTVSNAQRPWSRLFVADVGRISGPQDAGG